MSKKYFLFIGFILILSMGLEAEEPKDACYQCHMEMDADQDVEDQLFSHFLDDIHVQKGLGCADCHGGNPEAFDDEDEAMWDDDTYLGEISPKQEIAMCGQCHSNPEFMRNYSVSLPVDQATEYWTSKHGIALKKGNQKVATCTDCHSVHGILAIDNPNSSVYHFNVPKTCSKCHSSETYMAGILDSTNQYEQYVTSVHGVALLERKDTFAPACNDCHGNHGATPPQVNSIQEICGSCHAQNRDLFSESVLHSIFTREGLPQCESCHGNHGISKPSDDYLNWESGSICQKCHEDGGVAQELAAQLYATLDSLKSNLDSAKFLVEQTEIKGMEISDLYFNLEDAHTALIHTRTSIHSFDIDYVRAKAAPGILAAEEAKTGSRAALNEFDYRRKGLFAASFIITLFALLLYLRIKRIEKNKLKDTRND